jgi:hypothetical protein
MSNRYKVTSPWGGIAKHGSFYIQEADVTDTRTGTVYEGGAQRVVSAANGMKPAVRGKGGTVPFVGECAWMDAERLARDLAFKEAYA